jgi:hypothetical protein
MLDSGSWIRKLGKLCSLAFESVLRLTEPMDRDVIPAKAGIQ